MSSISLSKPHIKLAAPRRTVGGRSADRMQAASMDDQDRPTAANETFGPVLFWKVVVVLAMVLFINAATGMALHGADWLTAYWDVLAYWCTRGYCN